MNELEVYYKLNSLLAKKSESITIDTFRRVEEKHLLLLLSTNNSYVSEDLIIELEQNDNILISNDYCTIRYKESKVYKIIFNNDNLSETYHLGFNFCEYGESNLPDVMTDGIKKEFIVFSSL